MSEVPGLDAKQENRLQLYRELDDILDRGFTGEIVIHCLAGDVPKYDVLERRKLGADRRHIERRREGPRDGEDRRHRA